jgi:hypothetical protein
MMPLGFAACLSTPEYHTQLPHGMLHQDEPS